MQNRLFGSHSKVLDSETLFYAGITVRRKDHGNSSKKQRDRWQVFSFHRQCVSASPFHSLSPFSQCGFCCRLAFPLGKAVCCSPASAAFQDSWRLEGHRHIVMNCAGKCVSNSICYRQEIHTF